MGVKSALSLRRTRSRRWPVSRFSGQPRKSITQKPTFPPAGRPQPRVGGFDRPLLATAGNHGQQTVGANVHHEPIFLDVVPVALAVLLGLHRLGARARVSAVLRRRINHAIAGSVHCPSCWASAACHYTVAGNSRPLPSPLSMHHRIQHGAGNQYEWIVCKPAPTTRSLVRALLTLRPTGTLNADGPP